MKVWAPDPQNSGGGTNPHTKYFYTQPGTETRRMLLLYRQSRMGCQGVIHIMYTPPAGVTLSHACDSVILTQSAAVVCLLCRNVTAAAAWLYFTQSAAQLAA